MDSRSDSKGEGSPSRRSVNGPERSEGFGMPGMKRREFVKTVTSAGAGLMLEGGSIGSLFADEVKPDPDVKRVLTMFKCHFDAGFIDTQANVVRRYFSEYFPRA